MMQRVGFYCWWFQVSDRSTCTSDRTQSRWTGSISSKPAFKGPVCSDIISSFYSFDACVSSDGNSYFFKKLKHKRKLKKLQTDLATAKQEAAITVLELNEKIKTLREGKPAPRGQYYHVTVTHWPLVLGDAYSFSGNKAESKATVPGSVLVWPDLHSAWLETARKLLTPSWVWFHRVRGRGWISGSLKKSLWDWRGDWNRSDKCLAGWPWGKSRAQGGDLRPPGMGLWSGARRGACLKV